MIERKIIIGLIISTKYIKSIRPIWDIMLIESSTAKLLARWAIEYYDKYKQAPNTNFETIFYQKLNEGLDKETAEEIEEDILPDLSDEAQANFNVDYLIDETEKYFKSQKLIHTSNQIGNLLDNTAGAVADRLEQAEKLISDFKAVSVELDTSLDFSKEDSAERIKQAYKEASDPLIKWPKQLGDFWNHQFIPGAFISFLAPEKRGKTFLLLEIIMRALRQGKTVAFFQAGDMNEADQIKRIGTYLLKKSHNEKYCTEHFEPVRDCIENQMDTCTKSERECSFGPFADKEADEIKLLEKEDLIEAATDMPDYKPCYNCEKYNRYKLGAVWLQRVEETTPSSVGNVEEIIKKFFVLNKRKFKMSTHANGTLSFPLLTTILDRWQEEDNFVPDVILSDYMDIMASSSISKDFRHQENQKWKDARKLSQTPRNNILPCFISPTQADAGAYKVYRLQLDNYSEDKRKYAHVTAMYGLNQDPLGREKKLGILRINEIIIREGEYSNDNEITVLQNLRKGRPYRQAYYSN